MDETADISRHEQVSCCLRYIVEGEFFESFIGFNQIDSTTGDALCALVLKILSNASLSPKNIVGMCFDGASNMKGINKGLATRMIEHSPQALYVHCYGHLLNLAIQDALSGVTPLRNTLGTIQELYNFIEGSPKRHLAFQKQNVIFTLKSQSATRWSCRHESVKAVIEQFPNVVNCLIELSSDSNPSTSTKSSLLLSAICSFNFIFCTYVLRTILSNTASLSRYLQSETMDVRTARKTSKATAEALKKCRNDESFETVWTQADLMAEKVKLVVSGTFFVTFSLVQKYFDNLKLLM